MVPTLSHSVPAHTYRSPCTRYASPLLPVGGSSLGESKDPRIVTPVPAGPCGPSGPCGPGLLSICVLSCLGVMYDTSSVPAATSASVAGTFFVAPASIPVSLVRSDAVITSAAFALLDSAPSRPSTLDMGWIPVCVARFRKSASDELTVAPASTPASLLRSCVVKFPVWASKMPCSIWFSLSALIGVWPITGNSLFRHVCLL